MEVCRNEYVEYCCREGASASSATDQVLAQRPIRFWLDNRYMVFVMVNFPDDVSQSFRGDEYGGHSPG